MKVCLNSLKPVVEMKERRARPYESKVHPDLKYYSLVEGSNRENLGTKIAF